MPPAATAIYYGLSCFTIPSGLYTISLASSTKLRKYKFDLKEVRQAKKETKDWVQETLGKKNIFKHILISDLIKSMGTYVDYLALPPEVEGADAQKAKNQLKPFLFKAHACNKAYGLFKAGFVATTIPLCLLISTKIFPSYGQFVMKNTATKLIFGLFNMIISKLILAGFCRYIDRHFDGAIPDEELKNVITYVQSRLETSSDPNRHAGWFCLYSSNQDRLKRFQQRQEALQKE